MVYIFEKRQILLERNAFYFIVTQEGYKDRSCIVEGQTEQKKVWVDLIAN